MARLVVELPEELSKRLDAEVERTYSTRKAIICRLLETLPEAKEDEC